MRVINVSLRTNILVLLVVFFFGGLFVLLQSPPGGPEGVAAATTRGNTMLVVRLPLSRDRIQREITVHSNEPQSKPRTAIASAVGSRAGDPYKEVQLAFEQWAAIDTLRDQWCITTPDFSLQQDAPFYDVGLRCDYSGSRSSKRVMVPMGELPDALQEVLHVFGLSIE